MMRPLNHILDTPRTKLPWKWLHCHSNHCWTNWKSRQLQINENYLLKMNKMLFFYQIHLSKSSKSKDDLIQYSYWTKDNDFLMRSETDSNDSNFEYTASGNILDTTTAIHMDSDSAESTRSQSSAIVHHAKCQAIYLMIIPMTVISIPW